MSKLGMRVVIGGNKLTSKSSVGVKRSFDAFMGHDEGSETQPQSIGMKLLKKMGYTGGGLGKHEQGIVAPIEASLRPKYMGIGYHEYHQRNNLPPPLKQGSVKTVKREEKPWKKKSRVSEQENIITPDELLAMEEEMEGTMKVIDRRGPKVRVLTNLKNLNAEERDWESDVPMPELQHNKRRTVELAERDIQKIDRNLRMERETVIALQEQKEKLKKEAEIQKKQMESMEEVMKVLARMEEEQTLESLEKEVEELKRKFPEEYRVGNLEWIACSCAIPLLRTVFQGWDPMRNPNHGVEAIARWKGLLQDASDTYSELIEEVVVPVVRRAGINSWKATDTETMLRFLQSWEDLLPQSVLQHLLDMIVMPKLSQAVNSWETIPIHCWVHPWLPLLGKKLEPLYQGIQTKLATALCKWHPRDTSAYTILLPWKTVFDAASWEQLMVRSIIPKLKDVMQEFQVNPANQILEQFYWIITWANVVPIHLMVNLLELHFFNKWHEVLFDWLISDPDFEEVMQWYLEWKGLFPDALLANERIRTQLYRGLDLMNTAAELELVQPGGKENIGYPRVQEQRQYEAPLKAAQQTDTVPKNLKEILEAYAQQHGLHFKPKPGRFHNHHQVYSFGSVSVIVDSKHETIQARVKEEWRLVSLDQLLQMQNVSGSRSR